MAAKTKKTASKKSTESNKKTDKNDKVTVAKSSDGTVQITFKFPWKKIEGEFDKVVTEMGKDVEVAGFRKGKAPREKILEKLDPEQIVEHTLQHILPLEFNKVLTQKKIQPAMYPKFEVVSANFEEDWQVRAVTCEMPQVNLGKYKEAVKGEIGKANIVTPDNKDKELSREEKEQLAIKALMEEAEVEIPTILAQQESDTKLSQLLERLEKLGLTLDKYLESVKKSAEDLRAEYLQTAKDTIKMELVLLKIAEEENIAIEDKEIVEFIKAMQADPETAKQLETDEQKSIIRSILKKRKVIERLTALS